VSDLGDLLDVCHQRARHRWDDAADVDALRRQLG
jgi:hypothetical protein